MAENNAESKAPWYYTESDRIDSVTFSDAIAKLRGAGIDLGKVDVKSDGVEEGDARYRNEALKFIDKECLRLPDPVFKRLVEQIVEVLKRKDVEIGSVVKESKDALDALRSDAKAVPDSQTATAGTESGSADAAASVTETRWTPENKETGKPLSHDSTVSEFVDAITSGNVEDGAARLSAYFIDCDPRLRDGRLYDFLGKLETDADAIKRIEKYVSKGKTMNDALYRSRWWQGSDLWWSIENVTTGALPPSAEDSVKTPEDKDRRIEEWAANRKKYRDLWAWVLETGFKVRDSKSVANLAMTISGFYATDESRPHSDIFVTEIRTNPVVAMNLVANFTDDCPLVKELQKTESGRYACDVIRSLRTYAANLHGLDVKRLPKDFEKNLGTEIIKANERASNVRILEDKNRTIRNRASDLWEKVRDAFSKGEKAANALSKENPWADLEDLSREIDEFFKNDVGAVRKYRDETFGAEDERKRHDSWNIVENVSATRWMFDDFIGFAHNESKFGCFANSKNYTIGRMKELVPIYDENFRHTDMKSALVAYEKRNAETWRTEIVTTYSSTISDKIREEMENGSRNPNWPEDPELIGKFLETMHAKSGGGERETMKCIRDELGKYCDDFIVRLVGLHKDGGASEKKILPIRESMTVDAYWAITEILNGKGDMLSGKLAVKFKADVLENGLDIELWVSPEKAKEIVRALEKARTDAEKSGGRLGIVKQIDIVKEALGGVITFRQVEVFLEKMENISFGEAGANERLAEEIIGWTSVVGKHPGYQAFLSTLWERVANGKGKWSKSAENDDRLLLELPSENLTADAFYAELRKNPKLAEKILELADEESLPDDKDSSYANETKKRIESFAQWLRYKVNAGTSLTEGFMAGRMAAKAGENTQAGKGGQPVPEDWGRREFSKAERESLRAVEYAYEVQALRSEGKSDEAAALAEKVFWNREIDLRKGLTEKEASTAAAFVAKEPATERARAVGDADALRTTPSSVIAERVAANLQVGETVRLPIGGRNDEVSVTNEGGNRFLVTVDGKKAYECPEKDLGAHLDMAKFLCENGLAFLAEHSEEILKRASVADGNLKEADGGSFGPDEKRKMLSTVASVFGVEGFPHGESDVGRMESYLRTYATERKTDLRRMGRENGLLDEAGNVRNPEKLYERAKAA